MRIFTLILILLLNFFSYTVLAKDETVKTVKLVPKIRIQKSIDKKYHFRTEKLRPFLATETIIDSEKQLQNLPYILEFTKESEVGGTVGDLFYARNIKGNNTMFSLVGEKKIYYHPITKECLGIGLIENGVARLKNLGDISLLELTETKDIIDHGELLMPKQSLDLPEIIEGYIPEVDVNGYIIGVLHRQQHYSANDLVVISVGSRDGIQMGSLLDIVRPIKKVKGHYEDKNKIFDIPDRKLGELVVYKVYDKLSLGYVLESNIPGEIKTDVVRAKKKWE